MRSLQKLASRRRMQRHWYGSYLRSRVIEAQDPPNGHRYYSDLARRNPEASTTMATTWGLRLAQVLGIRSVGHPARCTRAGQHRVVSAIARKDRSKMVRLSTKIHRLFTQEEYRPAMGDLPYPEGARCGLGHVGPA